MSALTPKQLIYSEILWWVLPYARNIQTQPWWHRLRVDLYPELELVHNIPSLLGEGGFGEHDVRWINVQAQNFANQRRKRPGGLEDVVLDAVDRLVALVPPTLQAQLTYRRPD